jgi:catechol 2,3-dioxygenase-like lactoylglutathione lyase family enzyme
LLDHVVIAVSDRGRSNAFYGDVLGAEVVVCFRDPDGSLLELISYVSAP